MNPALGIIVILVCIALWFLASGLYKIIGKFIYKIGKDAIDEMMNDDTNKDKSNKKN